MDSIAKVIEKFASKKFGMMALSDCLIAYLCYGGDRVVVLSGILSIACITALYVWAVAHYNDNGG